MPHSSSRPVTTSRRGRQYRPPTDPTPYGDVTGGADARIAWLLGTTRLRADGGRVTRRAFMAQLAEVGVTCDESRVSRWEGGLAPIPDKVIIGYETVLGLPRGSLLAPARLVGDVHEIATPRLRSAADDAQLDQVVETVLDGEPTGSDWMHFATALLRRPRMYIRSTVWEELADGLVGELSRSLGSAYAARRVAARRLLADREIGHHLLRALDRHAADPAAPRVSDTVAMTQDSPDGGARLLQLLDSERTAVRHGAARAVATLLARGRIAAHLLGDLEARVLNLVGHGDACLDVAELVRRLPPVSAARLRARPRRHSNLEHGHDELVAADLARLVSHRFASHAAQRVGGYPEADPMLERLIREALFHTNADRRNESALLLGASAFRSGVASACEDLVGCPDRALAACATRLLTWCVDSAQLPVALAAAVNGPADGVRRHALTAIGSLPGDLSPTQARLLLGQGEEWRSDDLVDEVLYALGMHGQQRVAVAEAPTDPRVAERAAWWDGHGVRVLR